MWEIRKVLGEGCNLSGGASRRGFSERNEKEREREVDRVRSAMPEERERTGWSFGRSVVRT